MLLKQEGKTEVDEIHTKRMCRE